CNETINTGNGNTNANLRPNPRYSGVPFRDPNLPTHPIVNPPRDAEGDPDQVHVSRLYDGHAEAVDVNDLGNWAARGVFRFDPPWVQDMEWLLNVHGTRIDQLSTLGQAVGTALNDVGGTTGSGSYQEQDDAAELKRIIQARRKAAGGGPTAATDAAARETALRRALRREAHPAA